MVEKWSNDSCTLEADVDLFSKRIRIINYEGDVCSFFPTILKEAKKHGIGKMIVFTKTNDRNALLERTFEPEGKIDGYFNGHDADVFVKYVKEDRRKTADWLAQDQMLTELFSTPRIAEAQNASFQIRRAASSDAPGLADLYNCVFPVYPAPVSDPAYLKEAMGKGAVYYLAFDGEKVIASAGADVNPVLGNAEITDCAVLPEYRGFSLTRRLIAALETDLKQAGIFYVYSIARAASFGMNASLYHLSYSYRGRLLNNCLIYKTIENMNIWCKNLSRS
ncbi:putative beta-lysine N-acetyltransferase [Bacillus paralicheniformis]|uniref:putative beta-lysine N-acetyltransferase n=1 Tax=Bacillus TaxID=1386 RepID=UPI001C217C36|nr:putative beta-lysine N-acetyltransferase [Bacillus paralicheniformis]MBU8582039.1 putative beta-lysine N-acetyltransferase [Bacillus paralicheniformis]